MKYHIAAVSRIVGLSIDVIRSWERRYEIVTPERDASGVRLYSEDDVARLTLARIVTTMGHPIRRVARMANAELEEIAGMQSKEPRPYGDVVERLLKALHDHDAAVAEQVLASAALLVPIRALALDVLAPLLRAVGDLWERGRITVWQEHLISTLVRNTVGALPRSGVDGDPMLFATPPFDLHEFGIALASVVAASYGLRTINLGTAVPIDEVVFAAKRLRAVTIVIGMTRDGAGLAAGLEYAELLAKDVAGTTQIWLGGTLGALVVERMKKRRVRAVPTLEDFERLCRSAR